MKSLTNSEKITLLMVLNPCLSSLRIYFHSLGPDAIKSLEHIQSAQNEQNYLKIMSLLNISNLETC